MTQIIGLIAVLALIIGGLAWSGGPAIMAALPFELTLIVGAGVATLLISNSFRVTKAALYGLVQAVRGPKYSRGDYLSLLTILNTLVQRAQTRGILAIENDFEHPEKSNLFQAHPKILADRDLVSLISDGFRIMALDPSTLSQTEPRLRDAVNNRIARSHQAVSALNTLADALPALGIVAAVLGIIKTMGAIDQSPAVLGEMIAAALLGTFLGVFLAYGFVGPLAARLGQVIDQDALRLEVVLVALTGYSQRKAPQTCVEMARSILPEELRPPITQVDEALRKNPARNVTPLRRVS